MNRKVKVRIKTNLISISEVLSNQNDYNNRFEKFSIVTVESKRIYFYLELHMSEVKAIPPVPGNSFFILRVTASLTCLYKRGNLALENVVGFLM